MVVLGGLELVAAGYLIHEYNKEKRREQREDAQQGSLGPPPPPGHRRRRRRHSTESSTRPRPPKSEEYKYGYKPAPASGPTASYSGKPSAAVAGLYGATLASKPYKQQGSSSLSVPSGGPSRPNSAPPPVQYYNHGPYQQSQQPPSYMMAQNATYNSGLGPAGGATTYAPYPPAQQPQQQQQSQAGGPSQQPPLPHYQQQQQQHQAPYSSAPLALPPSQQPPHGSQHSPSQSYPIPNKATYDPRRRSDESLPLGIYEEPAYQPPPTAQHHHYQPHSTPNPPYPTDNTAIYELSAEGPWMHDGHRTTPQRPHVRIRLPNDEIVEPGRGLRALGRSDSAGSAPPAYRP